MMLMMLMVVLRGDYDHHGDDDVDVEYVEDGDRWQ